MSWDVSLHKKKLMDDQIEVGNYTYNVSPMYTKAMDITISELNGKICNEVIPILRKGILEMEGSPAMYKAMNPKNGWGDYEGALGFLKDIYNKCLANPKYKIEVF